MNRLLPDSGVSLACAGVVWCGIGPRNYSRGVCPLKTKQVSLTSSVARLLLGLTAVVVSSQVQAQQNVYYPPACNQSGCYNVQPATQYYQASYAPRYYQYSYAPQYYQAASTTSTTRRLSTTRQRSRHRQLRLAPRLFRRLTRCRSRNSPASQPRKRFPKRLTAIRTGSCTG